MLCADISNLLLPINRLDAIVSIETLYYLNHRFEEFLTKAAKSIKPNGIIAHSELLLQGNLLYALAFQDEEKIRSILQRQWQTPHGHGRLFTEDEMEKIYSNLNLNIQTKYGLSSTHGFISAAWQRFTESSPNMENILFQANNMLEELNIYRAMFFAGTLGI